MDAYYIKRNNNYRRTIKMSYVPTQIINNAIKTGYGTSWSYNDIIQNLDNKNVDSATVLSNNNNVDGVLFIDNNYENYIKPENVHLFKSGLTEISNNILNKMFEYGIDFNIYNSHNFLDDIPIQIKFISVYLLLSFIYNFFRNPEMNNLLSNNNLPNGLNSFKSSPFVLSKDNQILFDDVAGNEEAKLELVEVVDFLKNPTKFTEAGALIPKGIMLEGEPGTGKTLLAKAVAGEANVSFISVSGSEFVEMFVGLGAKRVRELFIYAKKNSPCVIFIDEIDAIGKQRGISVMGGNDEREQTLNQILTSMDGFEKNEGIIVLAATNRVDILDKALIRSGRFDRKIKVTIPDKNARTKILKYHFRNKKVDKEVNFDKISSLIGGFSGADIANLANEAAILSVRNNKDEIDLKCVLDAFEKMTIGLTNIEDNRTNEEKELIAYHEAGHTMMIKVFSNFFDLRKITINSNKSGAGGYTLFTPKEKYERYPNKEFIIANIMTALGGRVAEKILFSKINKENKNMNYLFEEMEDLEITTGASNDLKQANDLARKYISVLGLSDNIGLYDSDVSSEMNNKISEYTKQEIDTKIQELVNYCYHQTIKIMNNNVDNLIEISELLLKENTITDKELTNINIFN